MKPFGLALYLLIYPLVPNDESLNALKIGIFVLFILVFSTWLINLLLKSIRGVRTSPKPEYRWLYVFFFFLCFSPLFGMENNVSLIDWARDVAPLLNLLLVPIMADDFGKKQNHWLLYLFFVPWVLSTVQNLFLLFGMYDIPFTAWASAIPRLIPLHPSFGVGLGLLMYLLKGPRWKFWLIFGIINFSAVFLTPGRTIWITTGTMLLIIIAFLSHKRLWGIISVGLLGGLIGLVLLGGSSDSYRESQGVRFHELVEFQGDLSFQNRVEENKQAGELLISSPLYGVGFGYRYNFWRPFVTGIGPGFFSDNNIHNDIVFFASKGGLIGLSLFGLMLYGIGKKLFQRRKEKPNSLQSLWATIALAALMNSLIIGLSTPVFQSRWAAFALAILLAMGLGYGGREPNGSNPAPRKIGYNRFQQTPNLPGQ